MLNLYGVSLRQNMAIVKFGVLISIYFFASILLFGQGNVPTGTIQGEVQEGSTKDLIPGVNVYIEGTTIGSSTDINGFYEIKKAPVGKHKLVCSFLGFENQILDVVVIEGQTARINFTLVESSQSLNEVVITSQRATATENAVVMEMKDARQLVSGISRQQISKSQDSDAARVMQRVPGVTIVGNRFVMIRGVSERYNQIMINDVIAPSTEVDKRTFSFDLIQSGSLDRMIIHKTGAPEYPGDFAGGVIKIYTINQVEEDFTNVGIGFGIRAGTTFRDFASSEKSGTDFLGFDNGFRTLPSSFPSSNALKNSPRNSVLRQDAARSLPNNFGTTNSMALPDFSMGITLGRNLLTKGNKRIVTTNSLSWNRTYQRYNREFNRYDEWTDQSIPIFVRFAYDDENFEEETTISAMSNWMFEFNSRNRIKFSNLFNQIGANTTSFRTGTDFVQNIGDRANYLLGYRSRSIYSGQLEGNHDLSPKSEFRWIFGGSYLGESEPDLRRFRTFRPTAEEGTEATDYVMILPPSSNLFETGRYFGNLGEYSVNNGLDFTQKINEKAGGIFEVKGGTYFDYRSRQFDSRYFSYLLPGNVDPVRAEELRRLPIEEIFADENILTTNGFVLEEGTRPVDSYSSSNTLMAGYLSTSFPLGSFYVSGGVRAEYNIQRMEAENDFETITVDNPVLSILPSLNVTYTLSEKMLVRGGYSRTVNRPEFRELAPFLFYDYQLEAGITGNPNLTSATIDNLDLRYELYPRLGEVISIGGFYKSFLNPIENILQITTEQPQFTFANADKAENFGVEFEFRKSLKNVVSSRFFEKFSFNFNASYIWSQVDLGERAINQERVRALQGQSPYIVNTGVFYNDNARKLSVNLYYNIFGDRIFSVGDIVFPTIYELSRHSVDLTITKDIGSRVTLKAGVRDLLNAKYRFYQDSNRNGKIDSDDDLIIGLQRGQLINISASFRLHKSE